MYLILQFLVLSISRYLLIFSSCHVANELLQHTIKTNAKCIEVMNHLDFYMPCKIVEMFQSYAPMFMLYIINCTSMIQLCYIFNVSHFYNINNKLLIYCSKLDPYKQHYIAMKVYLLTLEWTQILHHLIRKKGPYIVNFSKFSRKIFPNVQRNVKFIPSLTSTCLNNCSDLDKKGIKLK